MSDAVAAIAATVLTAAAVKLLDDILDQDSDQAAGRINLAAVLGTGTAAYAALLLAAAAAISPAVGLALFFASYATGMLNDLSRQFPSRLCGWQETLAAVGLGALYFGWRLMLLAVLVVLAVQLADDCLDAAGDRRAGLRNLACRFGRVECLLAAVACLLAAWLLDGETFPPVFAGVTVFYLVLLTYSGGK